MNERQPEGWNEWKGTARPKSDRLQVFLVEYRALCKKHGCMILSEGEEIEAVDKFDEGLWGLTRKQEAPPC